MSSPSGTEPVSFVFPRLSGKQNCFPRDLTLSGYYITIMFFPFADRQHLSIYDEIFSFISNTLQVIFANACDLFSPIDALREHIIWTVVSSRGLFI